MQAGRPGSAWLLTALALLLCWPSVSGASYFERDMNLSVAEPGRGVEALMAGRCLADMEPPGPVSANRSWPTPACRALPPTPAYLVLADAWDEGWRASIDGRPAAVLRANVLFRAVALPGGRHEIVFAYEPRLLRSGIAVSCLGVIGLLGLAAARLRTSRSGI